MPNKRQNKQKKAGPSKRIAVPPANEASRRKLSNTILNPAVPWNTTIPTSMEPVNAALKYRFKCMPQAPGSSKFELVKREWKGDNEKSSVAFVPRHYRDFLMDLNWNSAYLADMFGAVESPEKFHKLTVLKMVIIYLHDVRNAFIEEVRELSTVSDDWRSRALDPVVFSFYFGTSFGDLHDVCESDRWHEECNPGAELDVFKLGESTSCFSRLEF
jgi:hypothetical protein